MEFRDCSRFVFRLQFQVADVALYQAAVLRINCSGARTTPGEHQEGVLKALCSGGAYIEYPPISLKRITLQPIICKVANHGIA